MGIDRKSEEAGKESKRHTGYKSSPFSLSFIAVIQTFRSKFNHEKTANGCM